MLELFAISDAPNNINRAISCLIFPSYLNVAQFFCVLRIKMFRSISLQETNSRQLNTPRSSVLQIFSSLNYDDASFQVVESRLRVRRLIGNFKFCRNVSRNWTINHTYYIFCEIVVNCKKPLFLTRFPSPRCAGRSYETVFPEYRNFRKSSTKVGAWPRFCGMFKAYKWETK